MNSNSVYGAEVGDCGRANVEAGGWQVTLVTVSAARIHNRLTHVRVPHLRSGTQGQTVSHLPAQQRPLRQLIFKKRPGFCSWCPQSAGQNSVLTEFRTNEFNA